MENFMGGLNDKRRQLDKVLHLFPALAAPINANLPYLLVPIGADIRLRKLLSAVRAIPQLSRLERRGNDRGGVTHIRLRRLYFMGVL